MIRRRFGEDLERGVSVVEFAILMPVFLPLIFLVIQAGLYFHAQNIAQAVAQTTARVVRTYPGGVGQDPVASGGTQLPSDGVLQGRAQQVAVETWQALDSNKTMAQPNVDAHVQPVSNQLVVTIHSNCINLLPGILPTLPVNAQASGPVEVFKPQGTN